MNIHGGVYREEDQTCLRYEVLRKICLTVDTAPNEEDQTKTEVEFTKGCYANGDIAYYEPGLQGHHY